MTWESIIAIVDMRISMSKIAKFQTSTCLPRAECIGFIGAGSLKRIDSKGCLQWSVDL